MDVQLEKSYGILKFQGRLERSRDHQLVFQSDDVAETMTEFERLCNSHDPDYGYMITFRDHHQQTLGTNTARNE